MGFFAGFLIGAVVAMVGLVAQYFLYYWWLEDRRWWKIALIILTIPVCTALAVGIALGLTVLLA